MLEFADGCAGTAYALYVHNIVHTAATPLKEHH